MFHKLPFKFEVANALCFVMHFTGLKSMQYLLKYGKSSKSEKKKSSKEAHTNIYVCNSKWLNSALVIAKVSEWFHVNLWLIRTKKLFLFMWWLNKDQSSHVFGDDWCLFEVFLMNTSTSQATIQYLQTFFYFLTLLWLTMVYVSPVQNLRTL